MRYALYFAPHRQSTLADLGARWLGRDARSGRALEQPLVPGLAADAFADLTAAPRRYGFHATLKAPFRLAEERAETDLLAAAAAFAQTARPIVVERIVVSRIKRFLALTPARTGGALHGLAAEIVEAFDPFRAPPSPAELERRRSSRLSPAQDALLARWGYPYVLDEFRFHITLTDAAEPAALDAAAAAARAFFADVVECSMDLDSLALFVEPAPGEAFRIAAEWPLEGAPVGADVLAPNAG